MKVQVSIHFSSNFLYGIAVLSLILLLAFTVELPMLRPAVLSSYTIRADKT